MLHTAEVFVNKRVAALAGVAALAASVAACSSDSESGVDSTAAASGASSVAATGEATGAGAGLKVMATTGFIGDAVRNIAPGADLSVLIGPGGDPHSYQPTAKDIQSLMGADVVLVNGLGLEAAMDEQLEQLGEKTLDVSTAIPRENLLEWSEEEHDHDHGEADHDHDHDHGDADADHDHDHGDADADHEHEGHHHHHAAAPGETAYDPHIWNDTDNWELVVTAIADRLATAQPEDADTFKANAVKYNSEISDAKKYVQDKINTIPDKERILVTGHDAFNYFGREFGLEIQATDFVTTESEKSAAEMNQLAHFIAEKKIPTIFPDNVKSPQAATALAEIVRQEGWDVQVSDQELYAGTLGTADTTDTYIGVLKHNADAIAEGLSAGAN